MIRIKKAESRQDIAECLKIRRTVFIIGQNVPEDLEVDEFDTKRDKTDHFLLLEDQKPIGTFRTLRLRDDTIKLQRFCVLSGYRNKGAGSVALAALEEYYKSIGINKIILDAQLPAIRFYERGGYLVTSNEFEEAGIMHKKMSKEICGSE